MIEHVVAGELPFHRRGQGRPRGEVDTKELKESASGMSGRGSSPAES